jgi:hypothetical protein
MRCTRCDGLAVPQAVGIDNEGQVIFGWCLRCLDEMDCRLVEVPFGSPWKLTLPGGSGPRSRGAARASLPSSFDSDQTQWILAIVAFLMVAWGLTLLLAGLFREPPGSAGGSPLGNGTQPLLCVGGTATAALGLLLVSLASRETWSPGPFPLAFLSWLSFLAAIVILSYGILDHQPRRNGSLVLGAAVALAISAGCQLLERTRRLRRRGFVPQAGSVMMVKTGQRGKRSSGRRQL